MCGGRALKDNTLEISSSAIQAAQYDLSADRREYYFSLPSCVANRLQPLLKDQRDLPILCLFYNASVTVLPAAVGVFALPAWSHLLGPAYFVCAYVLFLERYLLALHYSEHRKLFSKGQHRVYTVASLLDRLHRALSKVACTCTEHVWLNNFGPVVLAPFFGVPGGLYHSHHCVMHHVVSSSSS